MFKVREKVVVNKSSHLLLKSVFSNRHLVNSTCHDSLFAAQKRMNEIAIVAGMRLAICTGTTPRSLLMRAAFVSPTADGARQ